jgi:rod shape-determining protein MreC
MKLPQPEKSGASVGLLIVLVVLSLVITTVWFREGDKGPFHRARIGVLAVAAPVQAVGEVLTRPARGFVSWASDLGVSRSQLEALRTQNTELRQRISTLEEARLENIRLKKLAGFAQASQTKTVGARVIGRPTNQWEGVITIDRGSADGITAGMPVVGAQGLLGQTVGVTKHAAKVRLITDPRSGVAAMVQSTRAEGVVRGSIEGRMTLDFVSSETTVKAGDVVISSGMGGVYPKGLIVGEVTRVRTTPSSLYQDIEVTPAGELTGLEEVLVLIDIPATADVGGGE